MKHFSANYGIPLLAVSTLKLGPNVYRSLFKDGATNRRDSVGLNVAEESNVCREWQCCAVFTTLLTFLMLTSLRD